MTIRRSKQSANFTTISNEVFNDKNLRWRDLGLLVYLLSKPGDWKVSATQLAKERDAGRDGIYTSLRAIESAGYIVTHDVRDDSGKYIGRDYIVYDTPQTPHTEPSPPNPPTDYPPTDEAHTTKDRELQRNDLDKHVGSSANADATDSQSKDQYPSDFETAWSNYPKRAGSNPKRAAFKAWNQRKREGVSVVDLIGGVKRYARYCESQELIKTPYVMQGSTFFGPDERFKEQYEPEQEHDIWRDAV